MTTANSVAGAAAPTGAGTDVGDSIFDVVRRKWGKVQDVLQGMAAPLKRRSLLFDELPDQDAWPRAVPEVIEMSALVQRGEGHTFVPCHLTNPTWCDYCGDFIWGLYKQCMRCQTCQYTCHQHCVPAVNLNCKSIQDDGAAVVSTVTATTAAAAAAAGNHGNQQAVAAAARPGPPSSSHHPRPRLEPSRSLGQLSARPGGATRLLPADPPGAGEWEGPNQGNQQQAQCRHPLLPGYGDGSVGGMGTVPKSSPASVKQQHKHLSRSASEGYVTASPSSLHPIAQEPQVSQGYSGREESPTRQLQLQQPAHVPSPATAAQAPAFSPVVPPSSPHRRQSEPCGSSSPISRRPDTPPPPPGVVPESPPLHPAPSPSRDPTAVDSTTAAVKSRPAEGETTLEAATEKDETDSGYRSGTIPDDKLPPVPSQATLDRQELKRKITKYNHFVPAASFEIMDKESFQGFVKVTMNLIRPITMELGARPPSIYELLTREHIVEENTQHVAFYMPRDTHKSLHITSETTTKEVVTSLLKKFHILDHPRKFAMYDQEFNDKNKLVRLRRLNDKDFPLRAILDWDPERILNYRLVLQENETGEIVWDAFSLPELNNFMRVLDREEKETILELRHKYAYMRQYMERRLAELRGERRKSKA